jgi:hypothetical protein
MEVPKLDKSQFSVNAKVRHTIEDFPYLQAVAYVYLGKPVPKMKKVLTEIRKHEKVRNQSL